MKLTSELIKAAKEESGYPDSDDDADDREHGRSRVAGRVRGRHARQSPASDGGRGRSLRTDAVGIQSDK